MLTFLDFPEWLGKVPNCNIQCKVQSFDLDLEEQGQHALNHWILNITSIADLWMLAGRIVPSTLEFDSCSSRPNAWCQQWRKPVWCSPECTEDPRSSPLYCSRKQKTTWMSTDLWTIVHSNEWQLHWVLLTGRKNGSSRSINSIY